VRTSLDGRVHLVGTSLDVGLAQSANNDQTSIIPCR
jgi:hypothetical protein